MNAFKINPKSNISKLGFLTIIFNMIMTDYTCFSDFGTELKISPELQSITQPHGQHKPKNNTYTTTLTLQTSLYSYSELITHSLPCFLYYILVLYHDYVTLKVAKVPNLIQLTPIFKIICIYDLKKDSETQHSSYSGS